LKIVDGMDGRSRVDSGQAMPGSDSLKQKALELREIVIKHGLSEVEVGAPFDWGFSQWKEIEHLFDAVNNGNKEWGCTKV
jgi:hypothetical protein